MSKNGSKTERTLMQGSIAELRALYLDKSLSVFDAVTWFQSRIASVSQSGPALGNWMSRFARTGRRIQLM